MGQKAEAWVCQNCKFAMQKEAFIGPLMRWVGKAGAEIAAWILEGAIGLGAGVTGVVARKVENFSERVKLLAEDRLPPKESRALADEGQEILPPESQKKVLEIMRDLEAKAKEEDYAYA